MISLEPFVKLFAPHRCLNCASSGAVICSECLESLPPHPSICYRCHKIATDFRTCANCRRTAPLRRVMIAGLYEQILKETIHALKFGRAGAAAEPIGDLIAGSLKISHVDLVVAVPSAPSRFRQRGYNPAELIARRVAQQLHLPYRSLLGRHGSTSQVGAPRATRLNQLEGKIYAIRPQIIKDKNILLIDDVLTTGATLAECARVLKSAGAASIEAAVAARHHKIDQN